MKIVVIGTRGIPDILGGVETCCQELYPRLVKLGYDVTVIRRKLYFKGKPPLLEYKGVKLQDTFAIYSKNLEAILHTFMAVFKARRMKPDILHIHAVGPALLTPLARLMGMNVVVTHHGPDYEREKWGRIAKFVLHMGEKVAIRYANKIIVISNIIQDDLREKYGYDKASLIYNGVPIISKDRSRQSYITSLGLLPGSYIFAMGRFVPEKRFDVLIDAFSQIKSTDLKLVIAGDADHETDYSSALKEKAEKNNVILTGFLSGEPLQELLLHARLFVIPSSHEGLPIALLEAMNSNLDVLASNIPANKAVNSLPDDSFFVSGDIDSLKEELSKKLEKEYKPVGYDLTEYNWDKITMQVKSVYEEVSKERTLKG